jgi:ubiquinone biosynthesis accessory factor UbiJ
VINYPVVKFLNRVLLDYPMARDSLKVHAGKSISATVGPISTRIRVDAGGEFEMVGESENARAQPASDVRKAAPGVTFRIPLNLLPRLARGDESAFSEVVFAGDSEFASVLSSIARNIDWDVEEDLSHIVGDIGARRIVGSASAARKWSSEAETRLTENVAEYLTEEKRAFVSKRDFDALTINNENLRDALARFDARLSALSDRISPEILGMA